MTESASGSSSTISASTVVASGITLAPGAVLTILSGATLSSHSYNALYAGAGSVSVVNQGGIVDAQAYGIGVELLAGGMVSNAGGAVISATYGILARGMPAVIGNAGTIASFGGPGVAVSLGDGGVVDNGTGGVIAGQYGVLVSGGAGTITNLGTIAGTGPGGSGGVALTAGGALTNAAGGVIEGQVGVTFAGAGTLTNAGTIATLAGHSGTGIRLLAGGSLALDSAAGSITGALVVGYNPSTYTHERSVLDLSVAAGGMVDNAVELQGSGDTLGLADPGRFTGTVLGFSPGDTIDLSSAPFNAGDRVTLAAGNLLDVRGSAGVIASVRLNPAGQYGGLDFGLVRDGAGSAIIPCFARGTRVRTKRGEIAVEALAVGDEVVVLGGGARPVRWVGRRRIDVSRHPRPETVCPVHILPDALAPGVPGRGLWVSPGHSLYIEGALIPAEFLVNGATISRERVERVEYFHVELDAHAVLFSENLPSESYLDTGNRAAFENAGALALHPDFSPRHWSETCAPLVLGGERLFAARRRLLGRVAELGYGASEDADLHVRVAGRRIDPVRRAGGWHCFLLPAWAREARVLSRPGVPAGRDPETMDCRTLGARIAAIFLNETLLPLASPRLRAGFHPLEQEGAEAWRWSDGAGLLALPACAEPTALRLRIAGLLTGWRRPDGSTCRAGDQSLKSKRT